MVVPSAYQGRILGEKLEIGVGPVLIMAGAVVVERKDFVCGRMRSLATATTFVDVVAQMNSVVVLVFARSVAIRIIIPSSCGIVSAAHLFCDENQILPW